MFENIPTNIIESSKRFSLSKEEFAKERIARIKSSVELLQQKYSEVLSFCMYGSMVKGTAHQESDIDGFLFIDTDKINDFNESKDTESQTFKDRKAISATLFNMEVEKRYKDELKEALKTNLNLSGEQVKHVLVRPINEKIIDSHVADLEEAIEHESNILPLASTNLSAMFHLDVGGGIKKYRHYLLDKLNNMGAKGERVWREIIGSTEEIEQNLSRDTEKRYPRSLPEALKKYGAVI